MVDTVCPRAGYRRRAFHSRGCVEPLRSEEEERTVRMLVCTHVTYNYIGVPNPIPWKIPYEQHMGKVWGLGFRVGGLGFKTMIPGVRDSPKVLRLLILEP
jgi:hypothetical protein